MTDERLTPRQVANELGVTVRTVQRWIADGRLASERVGSRVRVSRSSLSTVADPASAAQATGGTLLIANRGEIAVRIARTARRVGMRVVGVHVDGERPAYGVDESHPVGSYLDGEAIVAVARRAGATAIHPGYGFLAENPEFAARVAAAGIQWVGPPAEAISAMGDKAAARRRVSELSVPTVPGYDEPDQDGATLAREAERIGYPLLVKPSAGGGGKGMRVVRRRDDLAESLASARREAERAFGDDRLILERYLAGSRHVEVQVLFDAHGSGVHLGERDCSAQRRNQKIVEEAPAPSVDADLRARMGDAALRVAGGIGYVSAGTVEMLLTDDGEFFFLEMNTRLQVEHPVTESVTGRDLVADQLRIAGGATLAELGLSAPPRITGHAIEARVYAEDPGSGFLPATGRLLRVEWPADVRVDTGARVGDEVSDRFDPMIAKVIAHGDTRPEALERLRAALKQTIILGVRTNLHFLDWLLDQPVMRAGEVRTDTIAGLELPPAPMPADEDWAAAAAALAPRTADPWSGGWRLNAAAEVRLSADGEARRTMVAPNPSGLVEVADGVAHVAVAGRSIEFRVAPAPTIEEAVRHAATGDAGVSVLVAPMPGRVVAVRAAPGEVVRTGQVVVVIEAMKMEHAVVAPADGVVTGLSVSAGQQVQRGDVVAEIGPASSG